MNSFTELDKQAAKLMLEMAKHEAEVDRLVGVNALSPECQYHMRKYHECRDAHALVLAQILLFGN